MSIDVFNVTTVEPTGNQTAVVDEVGQEDPDYRLPTDYVHRIAFTYVAPILICAGTVGNILSLIVLQSKAFRRAPSSFILSALALTDTGVLLCALMRHWIKYLTNRTVDIRYLSLAGCKLHLLFTYYLPQLSSWSLVLLTMERFVSVKWPFKAKVIFRKSRMISAWVTTAILLGALNSHFIKTADLFYTEVTNGNDTYTVQRCSYALETEYFTRIIWPWVDLIVLSLAPLAIIATTNTIIVVTLIQARRARQSQMQVTADDDSGSITAMLVGISVMFLLTTTPTSIYFIGATRLHWPLSTYTDLYNTITAFSITNIVYYLSNSTNFLIYCISGSKFRRALVALLCCQDETKSRRSQPSNPQTTSGSKGTIMTDVVMMSEGSVPETQDKQHT